MSMDVGISEIISADHETMQMIERAKVVAEELTKHYPNHLWAVGWAPGMTLIVRLLGIFNGEFGYLIHTTKSYSASDLAKRAVMAGGELLERCGVKRGAWNGEDLTLKYTGRA